MLLLIFSAILHLKISQDKKAILGTLEFTQTYPSKTVKLNGTLESVTPEGEHGFHVHVLGDIGDKCVAASSHYNPMNKFHGAPNDTERHVGDLGNVKSDANGKVIVNIQDSLIQLIGAHSVIGRSLVIHQNPDDLGRGGNEESKKTGNAGPRIGCGIIGITSENYDPTSKSTKNQIGSFVALLAGAGLALQRITF